MSAVTITYTATLPEGATQILAPTGLTTPHTICTGCDVTGGRVSSAIEEHSGQTLFVITPNAPEITLRWTFDQATREDTYPDAIFAPRDSRYTRFADDLAAEAQEVGGDLTGLARATAIACATAERFTYGHPEQTFNDGLEEIPALGCGMSEGSCVDINTYFIASLRAAGIEAGYVTGFFFPEEKGDHCNDGHCWVVTRIDGDVQEWDIAHHLKLGTRDIRPGLNPKPGFRAACFHSMGLDFPEIGITEIKALIEPVAVIGQKGVPFEAPQIRLKHPELAVAKAV